MEKSFFRSYFGKLPLLLLVFAMALTSFSHDADARRRRRRTKAKRAKIINEKKLYERIGGEKGLAEIIDEWVRLSLTDSRLSQSFTQTSAKPDRLTKFRRSLNEQLCELSDGPCQYKGPNMAKAHQNMQIGEEQFLAFSENLFRSMQKFNIPEREKNEILGRVGEFRSDLVAGEAED